MRKFLGFRRDKAPMFREFHPPGRSKYAPHQGARECERRRMGGFHAVRRCESS